jgi:hypothetical protein
MIAVEESQAAVALSIKALKKVASYQLPAELDRRILELGERKEELSSSERAELLAWVQFSQERSIEKFAASAALDHLANAFPETRQSM